MGTVRFTVPEPASDARRAAAQAACLAGGYETVPVPTRRTVAPGRLDLHRDGSDSGYVMVAWPAPGLPADTVSLSATLRERAEPYSLPLELARGRVNRLRTQVAEWEQIGLVLPDADTAELKAVTRRFGRLVLQPDVPDAADVCDELLLRCYQLADRVAGAFADQLLRTRVAECGGLPNRLGVRLTERPPPAEAARLAGVVTGVRLVPDWAALEPTESGYRWGPLDDAVDWAAGAGLHVSVGPLVDLTGGQLPPWLHAWAGDLPSLATFTCDFVETIIRRYQGRVAAWLPVGGFNPADALGLGEDDRLRLAARLVEAAGRTDPNAELVLSLGQPWGDYLAEDTYTYSPLVFADTLLRAGLRFAAVELELVGGPPPVGSRPRDSLEVYRLLELFAVLGLPLELTTGRADGWPEVAAAMAVALPQVRQVNWAVDAAGYGAAAPGGLFDRLRGSAGE